jgi:hypothetical protein
MRKDGVNLPIVLCLPLTPMSTNLQMPTNQELRVQLWKEEFRYLDSTAFPTCNEGQFFSIFLYNLSDFYITLENILINHYDKTLRIINCDGIDRNGIDVLDENKLLRRHTEMNESSQ